MMKNTSKCKINIDTIGDSEDIPIHVKIEGNSKERVLRVDEKKKQKKYSKAITLLKNKVFQSNKIGPIRSFNRHKSIDSRKKKSLLQVYKNFLIFPIRQKFIQGFIPFVTIGLFVVLFLSLIGAYSQGMSLKNEMKGSAYSAYEEFLEAADSLKKGNFVEAVYFFENAEKIFLEIENYFLPLIKKNSTSGFNPPELDIALEFIEIGKESSLLGKKVTLFFKRVLDIALLVQHENQKNITGILEKEFETLLEIRKDVEMLRARLQRIDSSYLPENIRSKFIKLESTLGLISDYIGILYNQKNALKDFLGDPHPKRYLILLQNNQEIRATGGFIGSFLLVQFNDGVIEKADFTDVYDIDNQLITNIPSPQGLRPLAEYWGMRDANYSPNFSTSVKDIRWFLDHGKGPTVNGVIAFDQSIVEKILTITGPIELPDYNITIHNDNFSFVMSYLVEGKFAEEHSPKQVVFDLAPILFEKIMSNGNPENIIDIIESSIQGKHIMMYFDDEYLQKIIELWGIDGNILQTKSFEDYLQVVESSVSGNKSDGYIENRYYHTTHIKNNNSVENILQIQRKHMWEEKHSQFFRTMFSSLGSGELSEQRLKEILGFGKNQVYVRVYVPLGSKLVGDGKDITVTQEHGKKVFSFFTNGILPGEEESYTLRYEIPQEIIFHKNKIQYSGIFQKQAGMENSFLEKDFLYDSSVYTFENALSEENYYNEEYLEIAFLKDYTFEANFEKMD